MTKENFTIQVTGLEAKGQVGEIEKPKHKFEVRNAKAPMSKLVARWLGIIREQGEVVPKNGADRFLSWVKDTKPLIDFIELEETTIDQIKYWHLNAEGERIGRQATYEKKSINQRINTLCGL